jgi:hypothetical protein
MVVSMTQDEIIEMAKKCGWDNPATNMMPLYEFAKLVAQHEREACAKLEIELILSPAFFATMGEYDAHKDAVLAYRNLIRVRGQV